MDTKAKVEEIVKKIMQDPKLLQEFNTNPAKTVEKLAGVDLPDDVVNQVVAGVKAAAAAGGAANILKKLF